MTHAANDPADETEAARHKQTRGDGDDVTRAKKRLLDVEEDDAMFERLVRQNPVTAAFLALLAGVAVARMPRLRRLIWRVATLGIQRRINSVLRVPFRRRKKKR